MTDDLRFTLQHSLGSAYRIERELGGGGMSRVFVAHEIALRRDVVVKVLEPALAEGLSVERFAREIRLAAALQEPHIVPVLTSGITSNGLPYYTMPFVRGATLRERMREGRVAVDEAMNLLRDVTHALSYAHAQGVVHRDIKPENILLSSGTALVTDFGIAKALKASQAEATAHASQERLTRTGASIGTPAYMAPEQATGDPDADERVDVYAFGIVAYELLSGAHPFADRKTPQQMVAAQIVDVPHDIAGINPEVPASIARLVSRCIAKEPSDRPSSHEVLAALSGTGGALAGRRRIIPNSFILAASSTVIVTGLAAVFAPRIARPAAAARSIDIRRFAVIPCENVGALPSLSAFGRVAADYLTQQILRTDSIKVVGGTTVAAILGDTVSRIADPVRRVAAIAHAGSIVTCSVLPFGHDSIRVDAHIVDGTNGEIQRELDAGVGPMSDPMIALAEVRERLLGFLVSGELTRPIVSSKPPRYSAYVLHLQSEEAFFRDQNFEEAARIAEQVIALDSSLTYAYVILAIAHANLNDGKGFERGVKLLGNRLGTLSAYDRLHYEWMNALNRNDSPAALRALQAQVARDSDFVMVYNIGLLAGQIRRADLSLPALLASDSAMTAKGWVAQAGALADAYHLAGAHVAELDRLRVGRRSHPLFPGPVATEFRALACNRKPTEALALADTLLRDATGMSTIWKASILLEGEGWFGAYGDTATGRQLRAKVTAWLPTHAWARKDRLFAAELAIRNGDFGAARSALFDLKKTSASPEIGGMLGLVAARSGQLAFARQIRDSLDRVVNNWDNDGLFLYRAAIRGEIGETDAAIAVLRDGIDRGWASFHLKGMQQLASLRGISEYEKLVSHEPAHAAPN
jgi:TolB-like protein